VQVPVADERDGGVGAGDGLGIELIGSEAERGVQVAQQRA